MNSPLDHNAQITRALTSILGDSEAAQWVVEQKETEKLRQRFAAREKPIALVSFDVDKIKEFVFASTKPLEVQGASEIVRDLTLDEPRPGESELREWSVYRILKDLGLGEENVLFAGGGTGLLLVPSNKAEGVAKEIQSRFVIASKVGSCSVVWQCFHPHELVTGPDLRMIDAAKLPPGVQTLGSDGKAPIEFGQIVRLLADRLRQAKEERMTSSLLSLPGYLHHCESCGVRAATYYDRGQNDWLCQSCHDHRERGREERKRLQTRTPGLETAESINEIGGKERGERGFVALIYADVDGMGQRLFQMKQMADYALFSRSVTRTMEEAIPNLVHKYGLKNRYQAPILGGDDIFLIVPARKAVCIVPDLVEQARTQFENRAKAIEKESPEVAKQLRDVTISVGFVVVPLHFDIRFSVDYAEALLRSAKKARRQQEEECIDYLVIKDTSPLSLEVGELRESMIREKDTAWRFELTTKPVTLSRFREMRKWISDLSRAGVSVHQLKAIETCLRQESPQGARIYLLYQWLRIKEWWEGFFEKDFSKMEKWLDSFAVQKVGATYQTGFIDLLELWELEERL